MYICIYINLSIYNEREGEREQKKEQEKDFECMGKETYSMFGADTSCVFSSTKVTNEPNVGSRYSRGNCHLLLLLFELFF